MEYITLNIGRSMPCWGWVFTPCVEKRRAALDAIKLVYRLFDTAQMYGNEKELGNALTECRIPHE